MTSVAIHRTSHLTVGIWVGFAMMCVGMFMAILDVQVVATSLPTIQRALDIPQDRMSWIQTAYLIAEIISIPLTGFLTRMLTMRWLFAVAVLLFTLASAACANSHGFASLITWRIVQGFSGGTLIPAVFTAVFLLFPVRLEAFATMVAGVLAVLAPTVGPIVGGWITQTYSWPWLFLINVPPGIVAGLVAALALPKERVAFDQIRHLDVPALVLGAAALAALEIAIKEAPDRGWTSSLPVGLLALCFIAAVGFVYRTLRSPSPMVELRTFRNANFSIGCILSFVLGMGLFGSVYLMPVFLAYVRAHNALEIGQTMLVTGIAQLAMAPITVALLRHYDERVLTAVGFLLFGIGLGLSEWQTTATDFSGMFWPQLIRGCAIMLCFLPPTQLALGRLAKPAIADASGLFNMMRNLGGAVGIAIIDTVVYGNAPEYSRSLVERLAAGDLHTAKVLGIAPELFGPALLDPEKQALLAPLVQKAAFTDAINDAWRLIALTTFAVLVFVPWARRAPRTEIGLHLRLRRTNVAPAPALPLGITPAEDRRRYASGGPMKSRLPISTPHCRTMS